jgi:hypothetical protein
VLELVWLYKHRTDFSVPQGRLIIARRFSAWVSNVKVSQSRSGRLMPKGGVYNSVVPTALTDLLNSYPASELAGYFQRSLRDLLPTAH